MALDEVFGADNFTSQIDFRSMQPLSSERLDNVYDHLLWYAKDKDAQKFRPIYLEKPLEESGEYRYVDDPKSPAGFRTLNESEARRLYEQALEIPIFRRSDLVSSGYTPSCIFPVQFEGETIMPRGRKSWRTNAEGMKRLIKERRIFRIGDSLYYKLYYKDFPYVRLANGWNDTMGGFSDTKKYVVETSPKVIERCIQMATDPGDLVLDPTCGSGTTAYVAEQWGRRWITCDTSRVALAIARQRLLTATFPYYTLKYPEKGVAGGFSYKTVPHITLRSIAQNEPPEQEILYDQPEVDRSKVRVSGPFTVEAIPVPAMTSPDESPIPQLEVDARNNDLARRGRGEGRIANPAADHLATMIELLRKAGVVFPGGKKLALENLRPLEIGWLHAEAEAKQNGKTLRVAVSFGPRHGPITAIQTNEAAQTASVNAYNVLVLAGFAIDPEAQAFIQKNPTRNLTIHFANVNPDVLVGDLLKTSRASQLFTVFGSPDVKLEKQKDSSYVAHLLGVDIYDPNTGELRQSRGEDVAAWFLDQDYDGYTFCISQAFFPADKDAWERLERALKGSLDPEKFEALRGTVSLPFQPGKQNRVAVKVIDMRGNEVIRILPL